MEKYRSVAFVGPRCGVIFAFPSLDYEDFYRDFYCDGLSISRIIQNSISWRQLLLRLIIQIKCVARKVHLGNCLPIYIQHLFSLRFFLLRPTDSSGNWTNKNIPSWCYCYSLGPGVPRVSQYRLAARLWGISLTLGAPGKEIKYQSYLETDWKLPEIGRSNQSKIS